MLPSLSTKNDLTTEAQSTQRFNGLLYPPLNLCALCASVVKNPFLQLSFGNTEYNSNS